MNVISLDKKEVSSITKRYSATATVGNQHTLRTTDDCKVQYQTAEEVSLLAKTAIKDGLQGQALLVAKKLICGDEWNKRNMSGNPRKKWADFLITIQCSSQQSGLLLDFAGYKEAEQNLIDEGVDVTPIDTASHYREAKKLSDISGHEAVSTTYTQAVEANGGVVPKTAKEVVTVVQASKKRISSEDLFFKDEPQWKETKYGLGSMQVGNAMIKHIAPIEKNEWKSFYRTIAKCVHPDKGGSEQDMSILSSLNEMMSVLHKQNEYEQWMKDKSVAYRIWCENYGCEPYAFVEDLRDEE